MNNIKYILLTFHLDGSGRGDDGAVVVAGAAAVVASVVLGYVVQH